MFLGKALYSHCASGQAFRGIFSYKEFVFGPIAHSGEFTAWGNPSMD